MEYMTLKEASNIWGISPRMINYYCSAGRIPRRRKMGNVFANSQKYEKSLDVLIKFARQKGENNCD